MKALKNKHFWAGFVVAYILAIFVPPSMLLGVFKGKGKGGKTA